MPTEIPPEIIAGFDPWGNTLLVFTVGRVVDDARVTTTDPATGNVVPVLDELHYLASLQLQGPSGDRDLGASSQEFKATGRLLYPATLDSRITDGSYAVAQIEGVHGRFEYRATHQQDKYARPDIRQTLSGTFRISGGPN